MTELENHPQGQMCVNGLYATFDPEFQGVSFSTIPHHEDDDVAVWHFTADWMGTEEEVGAIFAAGLVSVSKHVPIISLYTYLPFQSFSMVMIPPEE